MITTPSVTALNTSTFTAIKIPKWDGPCKPIAAYTEDGTEWYISDTSAGTVEATILEDVSYSNECVMGDDQTNNTTILFYAKASAGTPNLVVLYSQNPNR